MSAVPLHTQDVPSDRRYVDWFMWARAQNLSQLRCHGAAEAAVKAEKSGKDPQPAAIRGAERPESEIDMPFRLRELCNWYAWGVEDQKLAPDRALEVAQAAATSVVRGMTPTQAFDVAIAYSQGRRVRLGLPLSTRLLRDPGFFPLAAAIIVFGLAVFAGVPGFFLLIALFSFVVPIRAARFSGMFTKMMAAALLVDLAAIVFVAAGWHL